MPKADKRRLYQKRGRWYGDFRDFAKEGGRQEALIAPGESRATEDKDEALLLLAQRLTDLQDIQKGRKASGGAPDIDTAAVDYLNSLARKGRTEKWQLQARGHLQVFADHFGSSKPITQISMSDIESFCDHLLATDNGRGGTLSTGSVRKYLNTIQGMYRRAMIQHRNVVTFNPVRDMEGKPSDSSEDSVEPLEAWEVTAILAMAQRMTTEPAAKGAFSAFGPLVAVWALTGARVGEARGLLVRDLDLEEGLVYFRPNRFRRLKTDNATREVPIWPQLRELVEPYLTARLKDAGRDAPLFPGRNGRGIVDNVDKQLATCGRRLGLPDRHPVDGYAYTMPSRFRKSYISQRVQCTERGRGVAQFTLLDEVGHSDFKLIKRVYGKRYKRHQNPELVEWRLEHHPEALQRLNADEAPRGSLRVVA